MTTQHLKALPVSRLSSNINDNVGRAQQLLKTARSFKMCKAQADALEFLERQIGGISMMNNQIGHMADEVVTAGLEAMNARHGEKQAERDAAADPLMQLVEAAEKDASLAAQIYGN